MLLLPPVAHAGPIDEFESSYSLDLTHLEVQADGGTYTSGGYELPKASGTLDLTTSLSAFGFPNSQPIYAQGVADGNVVEWSFNTTFNPPIDLGSSTELQQATGLVRIQVTPLQGIYGIICSAIKCSRSVEYSLAPGSWVTVSGEGLLGVDWSESVTLDQIHGYAGAPRPDVRYFGIDNDVVGEKSTHKSVAMHFNIDRSAPKGGAEIELVSSAPPYLSVPDSIVIPEGKWFGTAYATLAPGVDGIVRVEARTQFGAAAEFVRLRAYQDPSNRFELPVLVLPEWLVGCLWCLEVFRFDEAWSGIGALDGQTIYFTQNELIDVADHVGVESATAIAASSSGWLTGTASLGGESEQGFVTRMDGPGEETSWLDDGFVPVGVTDQGLVVGTMDDEWGTHAALHDGFTVIPLAVEAEWSQATAASRLGNIAGIAGFGSEPLAFSLVGEELLFFEMSEQAAVPIDINDFGDAVANVSEPERESAYVLSRSGETIPIELEGYEQVHATAINDQGWVVGTATSVESSTGWLWLPSGEVIDLSTASPDEGLLVLEALDINDDGDILARTIREGEEHVHVLQF